jgi:hypothetical protein
MEIIFAIIRGTAFLWAPFLLGLVAYRLYLAYKQKMFVHTNTKFKLLEINIPKDIHKSPQAMEFIIDLLHNPGGDFLAYSSLEIASIEGSIYFFMRLPEGIVDAIRTTIYSQYPNVEISEVDDYTKYVPNYNFFKDSWSVTGVDFTLAKDSFLPIKTYIDYGLDRAVGSLEEYQKIDPLTPLLEYLGTLRPGEQIWLQYIIRPDSSSTWRKDADAKIEEMTAKGEQTPKLTHGKTEIIKSIERSLSKLAFECIIRCVYVAKKDVMNKARVSYIESGMFKPFGSQNFNALKKSSKGDDPSYFNAFIQRAGFYPFSWKEIFLGKDEKKLPVFTSEELVTLFHFPGRVSETSTLGRIEAKKAEPPANLPI